MEERLGYLYTTAENRSTLEQGQRPLSTRNLDELDRELAEIERKLLPLLNMIRAIRGEKPVYVPREK